MYYTTAPGTPGRLPLTELDQWSQGEVRVPPLRTQKPKSVLYQWSASFCTPLDGPSCKPSPNGGRKHRVGANVSGLEPRNDNKPSVWLGDLTIDGLPREQILWEHLPPAECLQGVKGWMSMRNDT